MIQLPPGQPPKIQPHYPHMLAEDVAVWTRFLQNTPLRILSLWYDVHVGSSVPVPKEAPEYLQLVSKGVTRKRIDALALTDAYLFVIEVKPYANMLALGQAVTYANLLQLDYHLPNIPQAAIVCDNEDPDIAQSAKRLNVLIFPNNYQPT